MYIQRAELSAFDIKQLTDVGLNIDSYFAANGHIYLVVEQLIHSSMCRCGTPAIYPPEIVQKMAVYWKHHEAYHNQNVADFLAGIFNEN